MTGAKSKGTFVKKFQFWVLNNSKCSFPWRIECCKPFSKIRQNRRDSNTTTCKFRPLDLAKCVKSE